MYYAYILLWENILLKYKYKLSKMQADNIKNNAGRVREKSYISQNLPYLCAWEDHRMDYAVWD